MNSIYTVANTILKKTDYSISNLRLNKFLYYVYGIYLATKDKRPWSEKVVASDYGPLFPSIYKEFKIYGPKRIKYPILRASSDVDDEINSIIDDVLSSFGHLTDAELIARTHNERTPWAHYYQPGNFTVIEDETIKEYFSNIVISNNSV